ELKQKQSEYKISRYEEADRQEQDIKEFESFYENNEAIKTFEQNRLLRLGSGDDAMNFEVDKALDMRSATFDPQVFYGYVYDQQSGKMDMAKWLKIVNYAKNMEQVESELINHGKTLGIKSSDAEQRNVTEPIEAAPPSQESGSIKIIGWK